MTQQGQSSGASRPAGPPRKRLLHLAALVGVLVCASLAGVAWVRFGAPQPSQLDRSEAPDSRHKPVPFPPADEDRLPADRIDLPPLDDKEQQRRAERRAAQLLACRAAEQRLIADLARTEWARAGQELEIAVLQEDDNDRWSVSVAFSPDGKLLASGGGELLLWDVAAGKELCRVEGAARPLVFSPGGFLLASSPGRLWLVSDLLDADLLAGLEAVRRVGEVERRGLSFHVQVNEDARDHHLAALARLPRLTSLSLRGAQGLSDAGLVYLQELTGLKRISVGKTKISDRGVEALKRALPQAAIDRD